MVKLDHFPNFRGEHKKIFEKKNTTQNSSDIPLPKKDPCMVYLPAFGIKFDQTTLSSTSTPWDHMTIGYMAWLGLLVSTRPGGVTLCDSCTVHSILGYDLYGIYIHIYMNG